MPTYQSESRLLGLADDSNFPQVIREGLLEFKNIEDEQCRKISSMSRIEVFEFMRNITIRSLDRFGVCFYLSSAYPITHHSNPHEIVDTIKAILMCIQSRLEGVANKIYDISFTV